MPLFARSFLKWLPVGVAVTLVVGLTYLFVQQAYRQDANDPQIAIARTAAAGIGLGNPAQKYVPDGTVDPSTDLGTFVIVIGSDKRVVKSSLMLGSDSPVPPSGTLDAATTVGENRVTWQPRPGVRIAAVIVPVNGGKDGWVVAGRSLAVVESRIDTLTQMAGLGLLGTLVATFITTMFAGWVKERIKSDE